LPVGAEQWIIIQFPQKNSICAVLYAGDPLQISLNM
jgi:hypothetical protein